MFEKRFVYLRGPDEDYSKDMKGLLMGNAERDQDLTVNENFGRPINNPAEEIELPKITDIRENTGISASSVINSVSPSKSESAGSSSILGKKLEVLIEEQNEAKTTEPGSKNKTKNSEFFGGPINLQVEDTETIGSSGEITEDFAAKKNEKGTEVGSEKTEIATSPEPNAEVVKENTEKEADNTTEVALEVALAEKNIEPKVIEKRKNFEKLRILRKRKLNDRIKTLRENPKKAPLLDQKDLRDLFTAFRVRNSKGEVKYPFEGLKVSQYIDQKPVDLGFRLLGLKDQLPKYLILAKLNISTIVGVSIDQTKLEEARRILAEFEKNKGKKVIDDAVYQASIDNEKKLLDYKKQIGELSGTEYRREYKKLLEKSRELNDNGIKINFSQNAFISSMLASPSLSYLGSKKENAKSVVVNKWKTFWKTRELRRGMLFSGLKNAVLFPPRYALKVPAYLLGYNFFRNRIRKKHNLSPITISSDLRKDFEKWGKGFEEYKKAPEEAKKQLEKARSLRNFDERFKDNESVIRANIEKGLPPPVSVDEKIFK